MDDKVVVLLSVMITAAGFLHSFLFSVSINVLWVALLTSFFTQGDKTKQRCMDQLTQLKDTIQTSLDQSLMTVHRNSANVHIQYFAITELL